MIEYFVAAVANTKSFVALGRDLDEEGRWVYSQELTAPQFDDLSISGEWNEEMEGNQLHMCYTVTLEQIERACIEF